MPDSRVGIIVLAAGASARMGTPKQLLKIAGVPLIRLAAQNALDSGCRPAVAVLGSSADSIAPELAGLDIQLALNHHWQTGMSGSIRLGLKKLLEIDPHTNAAILMLADQPSLTGSSLQKLLAAFSAHPTSPIAARYSGQIGTPALFPSHYFPELLSLEGELGAKTLLKRHHTTVTPIDLPEAAPDLDTPEQYEKWTLLQPTGDQ
jgi:molybdenum cofactor cytidylyltransferase